MSIKNIMPAIFAFVVTVTGYGYTEDAALNNCIDTAIEVMQEYTGDNDIKFKSVVKDIYTYGDVVECHAKIEVE